MTLTQLETALDEGRLQVLMASGNWWRVRRNGATKLWKRDAARFRIPYKAGLYVYGALTEADLAPDYYGVVLHNYRILSPLTGEAF